MQTFAARVALCTAQAARTRSTVSRCTRRGAAAPLHRNGERSLTHHSPQAHGLSRAPRPNIRRNTPNQGSSSPPTTPGSAAAATTHQRRPATPPRAPYNRSPLSVTASVSLSRAAPLTLTMGDALGPFKDYEADFLSLTSQVRFSQRGRCARASSHCVILAHPPWPSHPSAAHPGQRPDPVRVGRGKSQRGDPPHRVRPHPREAAVE